MQTEKAAIPVVKELVLSLALLFALLLFGGNNLTRPEANHHHAKHTTQQTYSVQATSPAQVKTNIQPPVISRLVPLNQNHLISSLHTPVAKSLTLFHLVQASTKSLLAGKPFYLFPSSGTEPPPTEVLKANTIS